MSARCKQLKRIRANDDDREELDHRWLNMHSEQLPDENGKPTKELMA